MTPRIYPNPKPFMYIAYTVYPEYYNTYNIISRLLGRTVCVPSHFIEYFTCTLPFKPCVVFFKMATQRERTDQTHAQKLETVSTLEIEQISQAELARKLLHAPHKQTNSVCV